MVTTQVLLAALTASGNSPCGCDAGEHTWGGVHLPPLLCAVPPDPKAITVQVPVAQVEGKCVVTLPLPGIILQHHTGR